MLLRERGAAQRIHGECARCRHVVHQAQRVSDLMGEDVFQRLLENVVGELLAAHALVYLRGLHEAPRVGQPHHVVVHQHRGIDDLARARIDPRGAHGVGHGCRDIADAGVFQVVGVEFGIVFREVLDVHDVLESDLLERLVPAQDAAADRVAPQRGECVVEVEDDGFDRFHEFAAFPCLHVLGLEVPAVDDREVLDGLFLAVDARQAGQEDADPVIGQTRPHRLLGQQQDRARHLHGHRLVLLERYQTQQAGRYRVGEVRLDRDVVLERLDLVDGRAFALELSGDADQAVVAVAHGSQLGVVPGEELGHIDDQRRTVAVVADETERRDDGGQRTAADGFGHVGVVLVVERGHGGFGEVERGVDPRELDVDGVLRFVADGSQIGVAGFGDGRSDEHLAADRFEGNFGVEFAFELVQCQKGSLGRYARLVVDKHLGVFVGFRFGDLLCLRLFLFGF